MEIKDIKGFENYQVTDDGRVWNKKKNKWQKQWLRNGYPCVSLKRRFFSVHRLVAIAFIPNPDNLPIINHKDENKTNNKVENLEWCTHKYNTNYGSSLQKTRKKLINGKMSKQVYQYTLDGVLVKIWPSASETGRNGFNQGQVSCCCRGEKYKYKGHRWSYKPL